jgi:catechol 2,3-dioxygenase-like lactoylglutathione lyase family enzyme
MGMPVLSITNEQSPQVADLLGVSAVSLRIADVDLGDGVLELVESGEGEAPSHIAFEVADLDAVPMQLVEGRAAVISKAPVTLVDPGTIWDGVRCVYIRDPDGTTIELLQLPSSRQSR